MFKHKLFAIVALVTLALIVAACGGGQPAPATQAPATSAPATDAPATEAVPTTALSRSPLQPNAAQSPLQPGTDVSPLQPGAAGSYVPLPAEVCEALRTAVSEALEVEGETETAAFRDYASGATGQGCLITVRGTGADFPSFVEVAQELETLLTGEGWTLDQAFAADSPTGTLFGLRKDNQLALVDVGWMPSAEVSCPADQPISACKMEPEQQIYTITINLAQSE